MYIFVEYFVIQYNVHLIVLCHCYQKYFLDYTFLKFYHPLEVEVFLEDLTI